MCSDVLTIVFHDRGFDTTKICTVDPVVERCGKDFKS